MSPSTRVSERSFTLRTGLKLQARLWVSTLLPEGVVPKVVSLGLHGW